MADIELAYLSPDFVATRQQQADALLSPFLSEGDDLFARHAIAARAQEWLLSMPWKRVVAAELVGDLLDGARRARVLDVGGGLSGITVALAQRQDYELVELATHEDVAAYRRVEEEVGRSFVTIGDWADVLDERQFDIVVANDLFPNVDQRLDDFVERFAGTGAELRLSLTYYEDTAFVVERVGSGERLTVMPWGLAEIRHFLERRGAALDDRLSYRYEPELFGNRRNVLVLKARFNG